MLSTTKYSSTTDCSSTTDYSTTADYSSPESRVLHALQQLNDAIHHLSSAIADDAAFEISTETLHCAQHNLRCVEDRVHVARLTILPVIEQAGLWASGPCAPGTFATWLVTTDDITRSTANREIRDATKLRDHLPATRAAALTGDVNAGQVEALLRFGASSEARCAALKSPIAAGPTTNCPTVPDATNPDAADPEVTGPEPGVSPADTTDGSTGSTDQADTSIPADTATPTDATDPADSADPTFTGEPVSPNGNPTQPTALPTGEEFLLGYTNAYPLGQFRRLVKRFAHVADPEADERGYIEAEEREYLNLSPTMGGWDLRGFLTDEHGQQLATAITALTSPCASNSNNCPSSTSEKPSVESPGEAGVSSPRSHATDQRTPAQKRAAALADLARLALDTGMLGAGAIERRQIIVHVSWTEFCRVLRNRCPNGSGRSGAASDAALFDDGSATRSTNLTSGSILDPDLDFATWNDDTGHDVGHGPIPAAVLDRIACDCDIRRVVFGPDGQVLDVGRTYRIVPHHIRTAVIARDRHCTYPGCDQPPERCEVHHAIRHWADGGETSAQNSALLCWHHHKVVDQTGITMRPTRSSDRWTTPPNTDRAATPPSYRSTSATNDNNSSATEPVGNWRFHDRDGQEITI